MNEDNHDSSNSQELTHDSNDTHDGHDPVGGYGNSEVMERRKAFGAWFRERRQHARLTQSQLAKALQYDTSQLISNIERGVSLIPSRRIPEFAKALGCSLLELEVRYFQCSARHSSESRMPDLLLKYLPIIEAIEVGRGTDNELQTAIDVVRQVARKAG